MEKMYVSPEIIVENVSSELGFCYSGIPALDGWGDEENI